MNHIMMYSSLHLLELFNLFTIEWNFKRIILILTITNASLNEEANI